MLEGSDLAVESFSEMHGSVIKGGVTFTYLAFALVAHSRSEVIYHSVIYASFGAF